MGLDNNTICAKNLENLYSYLFLIVPKYIGRPTLCTLLFIKSESVSVRMWQDLHCVAHTTRGFCSSGDNSNVSACLPHNALVGVGPPWSWIGMSFSYCADASINYQVLPILFRQIPLQHVHHVVLLPCVTLRIFRDLHNLYFTETDQRKRFTLRVCLPVIAPHSARGQLGSFA